MLLVVFLFLYFPPCLAVAPELDGHVSETESFPSPSTQNIIAPADNNQLPGWFGVADPTSRSAVTTSPNNTSLPVWFGKADISAHPIAAETSFPNQSVHELKIQSGVPASDSAIDRPSWIPLRAYTNDNMVGLYGSMIPWLRSGRPISSSGEYVHMLKSISQYWRDGRYGACNIWCCPISGHPGNFAFMDSNDSSGPRGWLQDTGQCLKGKRIYRYWFDQ